VKADPSATPTEQARHAAGWLSATEARRASIPLAECCQACEHAAFSANARTVRLRCNHPAASWATTARATCARFERRADLPAPDPREQIRMYQRIAADLRATDRERDDAAHAAGALRAQLRPQTRED
jgi:hypothetical protein